ncbi:AAA domain-containing protein [Acinetobacter soli]|uniref:PLD phosphodiesterase domain-containing protein n=1 Tax=Acinetobacter soli TaxID=487316 RepID=A0A1P8EN32_9GAMM|nr:AAA domain-containing protein [Acinetobacter soli]APV37616.1 hypothetical protein BEN76_16285 [Acinetobacter soli]
MPLDQAHLLKAWQRYIEITGCEKTKIPVRTLNKCQSVIFKDADLVENSKSNGVFIEIHPRQISNLKEKFVVFNEETESEELTDALSFAFPLLTVHEKNDSFYLPLFVVDLPEEFLLKNATGFDIAANEPESVKINIAVLINYFDVDADQIDETRNIIDLVSLICDTTFPDFKSMYFGFIQWANEKLTAKNNNFKFVYFEQQTSGVVFPLRVDDFGTNRDLEDFKHILEQIDKHGANLVPQNYPLLHEYLIKQGESESLVKQHANNLPNTYGLFESKYALGRGQYQAIQVANIKPAVPLTAVQGAPGTGKTTLFKSLIAQQVTARALAIIDDRDENMNMLVCSTAIKAVDNVIFDLKADPYTKDLSWLWFHGGANSKVQIEIQDRLGTHISNLLHDQFDEPQYKALKQQILAKKNEIDGVGLAYKETLNTYLQAKQKIPFISPDTDLSPEVLDALLVEHQAKKANLLDNSYRGNATCQEFLREQSQLLLEQINQNSEQILQIQEALEHTQHLLNYWPKKFTPSQFADWMQNKKVRGSFPLSFGDFFKLQFLKLIAMFSPAKANLRESLEILSQHDQLSTLEQSKDHAVVQRKVMDNMLQVDYDLKYFKTFHALFMQEYADCQDLSDVLRLKAIKPNREIFELSIQFLYQEQLKRKNDLIEALNHWAVLLKGERIAPPMFNKYIKTPEILENFYNLVSLAYPVVASTLASAYKMSGYKQLKHLKQVKPWNLTLLDEAGMVSVESLVPVLTRSNCAMIVGDPLQLEPIRTISKPSIQGIYKEYFKGHDDEYAMLGPGIVTTYHRAAGTRTGDVGDIGDGIILDEHRRCQAPIAQLFIDIAQYKALSISTTNPHQTLQDAFKGMGSHHLMFYHVDGYRSSGKTNLDEMRAIDELLDELQLAGYDLSYQVGIITPYADQKLLLIKAFGKRLYHKQQAKIGTIHQFQGVGFDVIIFSSVIFEQSDSPAFLNSRPNMLNVAVSRAKQQFIVVGNYHKLKQAQGPLGLMAERTAEDFYLELGNQSPSYDHLANNFLVERNLLDQQHIKAFEYYLGICEKSVVIVVPWIRKPSNSSVQKQLELIQAAKKRGVDIKVYYGYSNLELNQKDDNDPYLVQQYINTLGADNVIRVPQGTHEKILLIDDRILIIGSWNWLSNAYYKWYELQEHNKANLAIRRETSVIILDRKIITEYKSLNLLNKVQTIT